MVDDFIIHGNEIVITIHNLQSIIHAHITLHDTKNTLLSASSIIKVIQNQECLFTIKIIL